MRRKICGLSRTTLERAMYECDIDCDIVAGLDHEIDKLKEIYKEALLVENKSKGLEEALRTYKECCL